MLEIKRDEVMNFLNALRGMRNPMNSWDQSDTTCDLTRMKMGEKDLSLCTKLIKSGTDHRKFMRQILVSVDINAPLYWWKEFDTYKVATVANSCSTMHKIHSSEITLDDFSVDKLSEKAKEGMQFYINYIEDKRKEFIETKDKDAWYEIIQLLPSSYNQMRTITMNYETLLSIHRSRRNHKLDEWHVVCDWIEGLPYMKEFLEAAEGKPVQTQI